MAERVEAIKLHGKNGKEFTLDFDLDSVRFAEAQGFEWDAISNKPGTMVPILWFSAFRKNHKRVSRKEADDMLEGLGGFTKALSDRLAALYFQALSGIIATDDDENEAVEKNAEWTVEL